MDSLALVFAADLKSRSSGARVGGEQCVSALAADGGAIAQIGPVSDQRLRFW